MSKKTGVLFAFILTLGAVALPSVVLAMPNCPEGLCPMGGGGSGSDDPPPGGGGGGGGNIPGGGGVNPVGGGVGSDSTTCVPAPGQRAVASRDANDKIVTTCVSVKCNTFKTGANGKPYCVN